MDWVTLKRQQIEVDGLPDICMVCGESATDRVDKTFSHTPPWVEHLYYLGFFPGWIASQFFCREMRVSCPVCSKHRTHWSKLAWLGSVGWLVAVPCAVIGFVLGRAVEPASQALAAGFAVAGAMVGLAIWLAFVIRMGMTRVKVTAISSDGNEITLQHVSPAFALASRGVGAEA